MSVAVTITGQGTVTQTTASYDETYSLDGASYRPHGTVYTLTAIPAAGWRFKRWYQPNDKTTQDSTYTHTWYPLSTNPRTPGGESNQNPLQTNLTSPLPDVPDGRFFLLFEGDYDVTYSDGSVVHYVFHDLAITAEFELAPIADGPILRTDGGNPRILRSDAGIIIRQG